MYFLTEYRWSMAWDRFMGTVYGMDSDSAITRREPTNVCSRRVVCQICYLEQKTIDIVEDGIGHEGKEEIHAPLVDGFDKPVGESASGYNLYECEEDITAIQCRDGQKVHEGQHQGYEGGKFPEHGPLPCGGEQAAYGSKGTHALGS